MRLQTADYEIRLFSEAQLPGLINLINEAISGRRAAALILEGEFRQRVLQHPGFDPACLLLAVSRQGQLLGGAHAVLPPIEIPHYQRLAGQGFIFGPYVRLEARGRGIGRALLAHAERILAGRSYTSLIHGLRAPFYHAQEGPRQPYCGSTEVIGLTYDDADLLHFFHQAGYRPVQEQEVSMVARLSPGGAPLRAPGDMQLARISAQAPWLGPVKWTTSLEGGFGYEPFKAVSDYGELALLQDNTVLGHCQWYPMRRPGRVALYDLRLDPSLRGRGFGRFLLEGALGCMAQTGFREVELHTSPQRNAVAYRMYQQNGFQDVEHWIMLEKKL